MEFRKVYDLIPEEFDKWRPRYCEEAFDHIIQYADLKPGKRVLEIGPGTGQATLPLLQTECDYVGIELGSHLFEYTKNKFADYGNLTMINDDFCTHNFANEQFDMVFSAATIQWIPEEIAFSRAFELLKPGGCLVMIANLGNEEHRNSAGLLAEKNTIYEKYFKPETHYNCRINKGNVINYGFLPIEVADYEYDTDMTADDFVSLTMTHADHITLQEPNRSLFMNGLRDAINQHGGIWKCHDRVNIVKVRKPE